MHRVGWRTSVLLLTVALGVVGCASTGQAPVEDKSLNPSSRPRPAAQPPKPAAAPGGTYRVQRGDTLYSIAFRNGVDVRELAEWNSIEAPYTIYPGRELRLSPRNATRPPVAAAPPRAAPPPTANASTPPTKPVAAQPTPPPSTSAGTPSHVGSPTSTPPSGVTPPPPPPPETTGDVAWRWPADGQVVGGYVAGDPMKQGIDIAGNSGAPVRAAADGTVVYSGNGLIGYGELIIVKHNASLLSAYGHNRKRLVQEGDRVKSGQTIAEMGSNGAREELHFEIRKNGKPSNPLDFLPRR